MSQQPIARNTCADIEDDALHVPFFRAAIVMTLSLGAAWGAWLLLRIAGSHSFTAIGLHEVNAHGHAQIFGWVGLFVMGFAYHALPRFKQTPLRLPRIALATLWLMLAGILCRAGAQAALARWPGLLLLGTLGSVLEVTAAAVFVALILDVFRRAAGGWTASDWFIVSALAWFFVQTVYSAVYFHATATAPDRDALLALVATWQAPLRDVQIHGFALIMILGVSQRILSRFYGLRFVREKRCLRLLWVLNAAVLCEALGFLLMRASGHAWTALWYGAVFALAGSVVLLVRELGVFSAVSAPDRILKFVRTAYAWLLLSLAMLVLLPVYQFGLLRVFAPESEAARLGFSHAYYGAIRHAVTVGFISMMIVGVAARVVPVWRGHDTRPQPALWAPFLLLNAGCALRVGFQTLTDFSGAAFPLAGV
ncbi:MAG TPA: NnrS family protein, partial [Candidatus Hydrogenedentes bacterium]|nr:NnrS family protein [Candidatus Hydrogenedentota bacterium]